MVYYYCLTIENFPSFLPFRIQNTVERHLNMNLSDLLHEDLLFEVTDEFLHLTKITCRLFINL